MEQDDKRKLIRTIAIFAASVLVLVVLVFVIKAFVQRSQDDDTANERNGNFVEAIGRMTTSETKPAEEKDYTHELHDVKTYCTNCGMMIKEGETPSGFEAIGSSMKLVVTVEEIGEETFPELIDRLIWSSAPLNDTVAEKSTRMFMYEGLMDKDHPEYGYVYLRVFQCGDHYIFIQGLGEQQSDSVIVEARELADEIMRRVGLV